MLDLVLSGFSRDAGIFRRMYRDQQPRWFTRSPPPKIASVHISTARTCFKVVLPGRTRAVGLAQPRTGTLPKANW